MTFETFEPELNRLVTAFARQFADLTSPGYAEAQLRDDFLNPLFRALGWDLENKAGHIQNDREVEIESRTDIAGKAKRADYLFRTDGTNRFVCEAKKPREILGPKFAFQAKRYAWNKSLPLAVLSDFEEIKIYVVGGKPHPERPDEGLWKRWHFKEFQAVAKEIWDLLSRPAVAAGSIDALLDSLPKRAPTGRGKAKQLYLIKPDRTRSLDTEFLAFLDEARRSLGSDLVKHNPEGDVRDVVRLTEAVQHILDRLLFLRICEDRDIDTGTRLDSIVQTWRRSYGRDDTKRYRQTSLFDGDEAGKTAAARTADAPRESLWYAIVRHFRALDRRPASHVPFFNGQLFKHHFTEDLYLSDQWLVDFIGELSDDESPYLFNVIEVEILGNVYERFLGKIVRPHGRGVTIEEKPEVRKAGGVYYTPRYIVDYIVEQTVGKLLTPILEAKTFATFEKQTAALRLLDPACGSGSFLIRTFERVCEHWQRRLTRVPTERRAELCWVDPATGDVHLSIELKRRILRDNIYGVDIDAQAVEVTQLSLYLKMLENENRITLQRQRELFAKDTALLPSLEHNIKCGNSLIASDFSLDPAELVRVNAFDWKIGFREIMRRGGFDAVVGNPPYIRIQGFPAEHVAYFVREYKAATGNYDIYANFVERGLKLLNATGRFGMILPNKFFRTDYGIGLRSSIAGRNAVEKIVDFGADQVFDATTYTCLLFLASAGASTFEYGKSEASEKSLSTVGFSRRAASSLNSEAWTLGSEEDEHLQAKLMAAGVRLLDLPADMSRGSSTGDDKTFVIATDEHDIEAGCLRTPLFASDFNRYFFEPSGQWQVIFPYSVAEGLARLREQAEMRKLFPNAYSHLQQNAVRLRERKQFKEWFGYSAPRNLQLHERAQIAVPLLADRGLFALIPPATRGRLCPMASGGFTITLRETCALRPEYVLGILNSKLVFWFLRCISNVFRGGWITCTKQYFGELPILNLDLANQADRDNHDTIVTLVEKMSSLTPQLRNATDDKQRRILQNAVAATDHQIDQLVYELYGLTSEEIALVEAGVKA